MCVFPFELNFVNLLLANCAFLWSSSNKFRHQQNVLINKYVNKFRPFLEIGTFILKKAIKQIFRDWRFTTWDFKDAAVLSNPSSDACEPDRRILICAFQWLLRWIAEPTVCT